MPKDRQTRAPLIAVGLLLAANVFVPLVWGDLYPFTSAPMFRDCPHGCCNYRVYAPSGKELPAKDWRVHRVYDGNPVGYGVGIQPAGILETEFGVVHDEVAVRRHIGGQFALPANRDYPWVEVEQETIGPVSDKQVGVVRTRRWRVERP